MGFAALLLASVLPADAWQVRMASNAQPSPLRVLGLFDSLLEAGNLPAARALCAGQVLRMFDFLAMAQGKLAGKVDSVRSEEDTLEDSISGDWAYVKIASRVVFKQPFLGQEELRSVQAIHLWKSTRGWLLAEFQELEDAKAKVRFRTGRPETPMDPGPGPGPGGPQASTAQGSTPGLFPLSPKAPAKPGVADRIRYRIRLRDGRPLKGLVLLDARQSLVKALSPSEWILENRLATTEGSAVAAPDSLAPYLASNGYLILEDSLLHTSAVVAAGPSPDPGAQAASIRKWVTDGFRFQLGAVLFGNSRAVLRDMTGDCSEAAILSAALLRARGIPSRVALGFASVGRGVFIGHAWTEAWLGPDRGWVGVDAALGQYPASVERVKLAALDGRGDMRIAATNLMLAALSNLDIEITKAWKGKKTLPLVAHPGAAEEGERFFSEILGGFEKN